MMRANARLQSYCQEVLRFRRALNLTSVDNAERFTSTFIAPSLALLSEIPNHALVLDIGSGMGIPGIPLLIARDDLRGIMVERRKKRAEFLRHIVRKLSLNCEVFADDVTHVAPLNADVVVARAVAEPEQLLRLAGRHIHDGGLAILPSGEGRRATKVDGWCMQDRLELQFEGAVTQRVYRYQRVIKEDVSRET